MHTYMVLVSCPTCTKNLEWYLSQLVNNHNVSKFFSFCTNRLYGTYSEKRSKVVVLVARWTFSFLLIHNLVVMTNFALNLSTKLNVETGLEYFIIAHDILNEIELILVVLSVPMSYLMGMCCCGIARDNDMEMDKG